MIIFFSVLKLKNCPKNSTKLQKHIKIKKTRSRTLVEKRRRAASQKLDKGYTNFDVRTKIGPVEERLYADTARRREKQHQLESETFTNDPNTSDLTFQPSINPISKKIVAQKKFTQKFPSSSFLERQEEFQEMKEFKLNKKKMMNDQDLTFRLRKLTNINQKKGFFKKY